MQSESFICQMILAVASRRHCAEGSRKGQGGQRELFGLLALFTSFLLLLAQVAFWHWACSDSTLTNARLLLRMVNKTLTRFLLSAFWEWARKYFGRRSRRPCPVRSETGG